MKSWSLIFALPCVEAIVLPPSDFIQIPTLTRSHETAAGFAINETLTLDLTVTAVLKDQKTSATETATGINRFTDVIPIPFPRPHVRTSTVDEPTGTVLDPLTRSVLDDDPFIVPIPLPLTRRPTEPLRTPFIITPTAAPTNKTIDLDSDIVTLPGTLTLRQPRSSSCTTTSSSRTDIVVQTVTKTKTFTRKVKKTNSYATLMMGSPTKTTCRFTPRPCGHKTCKPPRHSITPPIYRIVQYPATVTPIPFSPLVKSKKGKKVASKTGA